MSNGHLGLPPINREEFNRLSKQHFPKDNIIWAKDDNNPNYPDPDEIVIGRNRKKFIAKQAFTSLFDKRYSEILELRRRELVKAEIERTVYKPVITDFSGAPADERDMVKHVKNAGELMDDLFQMQLGSYQYRYQMLSRGTADDAEFFKRYQRFWCESISDPVCNALETFTPRSSVMYPEGLTLERATAIGSDLVAPFTVATEGAEGEYTAVPYANSFLAPKMKEAAKELRLAAVYADRLNEGHLAEYMRGVAAAFESGKLYPYVESDAAWYDMKGRSKWYLRVGPDESQWEDSQKKAGFAMIFGKIDSDAAKSVQFYGEIRQNLEKHVAEVIGPPYVARNIDVSLPDFVNVITEHGDMRGSVRGTAAGQTLPNQAGEDGKAEIRSRTMIFENKMALGNYGEEALAKYGKLLPDNMRFLNPTALIKGVVDHEFAHNLGPRQNMDAGGGKTFEQSIGKYGLMIEELKAQTGSLLLNGYLGQNNYRSEDDVKAVYTANVIWMFGQLRRGVSLYKEGKFHESKSPYIQLAAVQLGFLQEKGAITFNEEANQFTIHYEKMDEAVRSLFEEIGQKYLRHDSKEVADFFEKYTKGDGLKGLHMDTIDAAVGKLPTYLFDWQVTGLEG